MLCLITRIFNRKRYAKRMVALAKIAALATKYDAFDMILSPETHSWLKRKLKRICYVSNNFILGTYNIHCVVACDRTAFLRHQRRR